MRRINRTHLSRNLILINAKERKQYLDSFRYEDSPNPLEIDQNIEKNV